MVELKKHLEDLRRKFADSTEFFDPRFRRVAEKIFKGGTRAAAYSGISTFASLPYGLRQSGCRLTRRDQQTRVSLWA